MEGAIVGGIMAAVAAVVMIYLTNRSRCSLEQAISLSECSEQELHELVKDGVLSYRRQYLVSGPLSFDTTQLADVRAHYPELRRIRVESNAKLRHMAEEAAARIAEDNRRREEQYAAHVAEMEMLRRIHAEMLKTLRISLMPAEVTHAFDVLGLQYDAPFDEIHRQYRILAKRHHPDTGGEQKQFLRIQAAYTCVRDWITSQR